MFNISKIESIGQSSSVREIAENWLKSEQEKRQALIDSLSGREALKHWLKSEQEMRQEWIDKISHFLHSPLQDIVDDYKAQRDAIEILKGALKDVADDPQVKRANTISEIATFFLKLLEDAENASVSSVNLDAVIKPVSDSAKKQAISESGRRAGSYSKKPDGKNKALDCWNEWSKNPSKFKSKTVFCKHLEDKEFCDTQKTAGKWVEQFRISNPSEELEKILPKTK